MGRLACLLLATFAAALTACGNKIGDECSINTDCSAENTRFCETSWPGGYCTVLGCDKGSCPEESDCIQFFSVINQDKTCATNADCDPVDEVCTIGGLCAARSSESRACMLRCGGGDDCREGYECRDVDLMKKHGGQPLLEAGQSFEAEARAFCAAALPCRVDTDCDVGTCQGGYCQ
jgi:hypothetical protein